MHYDLFANEAELKQSGAHSLFALGSVSVSDIASDVRAAINMFFSVYVSVSFV